MDRKLINQWLKERDAMIETLDVDELKKFVKKWHKHGAYDDMYLNFPSDETLKFDLCSMAWESDGVSEETKKKAGEWCYENGYGIYYESYIDNDREY